MRTPPVAATPDPAVEAGTGAGSGADTGAGPGQSGVAAAGAAATASLARSSALMAAGTVVSRVLGMVRTTVQAGVVGLALTGDTWDVANSLPNLLYLLLAGGVLNAVLVPQIVRAGSHADGGREFVDRLLTLAITAMAGVTVLVTLGAGLLVRLYSSDFPPAAVNLSTAFALICLPQVFFYGLYTLLGQVLNARGQFAAYMWAPVLANVVAIAGMLAFLAHHYPTGAAPQRWTPAMVWLLAGSATAGIAAQALALLIPLYRAGFRYRPRWGLRGVGLRSASRVAAWTFAALAVSQLGFVVTSRVLTGAQSAAHAAATGHAVAGKASYSNAFLLFMLPHSLVTVSLVTALFTRMSRSASTGDLPAVRADLGRGMRLTAVATVPATVGLFVLGSSLTSVLFFHNTAAEARGVYLVAAAMMAGLVPFGTLYLLQRVFYAFEDARTPFFLQLVVTAIATAGNLLAALAPLHWTAVGVGLAQTFSNLAGAGVGLLLVRRRLAGLPLHDVAWVYVRLLLAALGAAVVTLPLVRGILAFEGEGRPGALVALLVGGTVFAACYVLLASRMRVQEVDDLTRPLLARASRARRAVLRRRPSYDERAVPAHRPPDSAASRRLPVPRPQGDLPARTKEPSVQGVGPGSVLGHRYLLGRRTVHDPAYEMWSAHDQTLERPVAILVVDAGHPGADAALDAGRRAAGIEDSRLVRIFDVGRGDGIAYVVQEALTGVVSLSSLLGQGGLPADEARRIVGEAATALEVAGARGLHHQRLTPSAIGLARDGAVTVTGLAVFAALTGEDGLAPDSASRADAVGLTAVLYAALTGRWPLGSPAAEGLESAPSLGSRVAAPSEIAAGVPGDLDALCRSVLLEGGGPATPGEVAAQLAPWRRHGVEPNPEQAGSHQDEGQAGSHQDEGQALVTGGANPDQDQNRVPGTDDGSHRRGAPDARAATAVAEDQADVTVHEHVSTGRRLGEWTAPAAAWLRNRRGEPDSAEDATEDAGEDAGGPGRERPAATAVASLGSAVSGTRTAAGTVGGRVGSFARAAAQQAGAARTSRADVAGPEVGLPDVLHPTSEPEEPVVPLIGTTQAGRPSKSQSRAVVAILLLFVVLAMVLAYRGLVSAFGPSTPTAATRPQPHSSSRPAASSASPSSSSSASSSTGTSGQPLTIKSAKGFDPQGDKQEMNGEAKRAIDNNPASAWTSEYYSSANFGNLGKKGVGLLLDLGTATGVHQADLILPLGPIDVTLYATDSSDRSQNVDNATELGSVQGATGTATIKAGNAPKRRYVIVWFPKLVSSGGRYRASLAEISLR